MDSSFFAGWKSADRVLFWCLALSVVVILALASYHSYKLRSQISKTVEATTASGTAEAVATVIDDLGWLPVVKELPIGQGTGLKALVFATNGVNHLDDHATWRVAYVQNMYYQSADSYYPQIGQDVGGIEPGQVFAHIYKMQPMITSSDLVTTYFVGSGSTPGYDAYLKYAREKEKETAAANKK